MYSQKYFLLLQMITYNYNTQYLHFYSTKNSVNSIIAATQPHSLTQPSLQGL